MGSRGPVPNRSDDLSRERDASRSGRPEITKGTAYPATPPDPDPSWHPIATMLWEGLLESGQNAFYQQSDWAMAFSLCEDLSVYKKLPPGRGGRSGQMLQTIYSALERLLVTEGDRRRVRIELSEPEAPAEDATFLSLAKYREELGMKPD